MKAPPMGFSRIGVCTNHLYTVQLFVVAAMNRHVVPSGKQFNNVGRCGRKAPVT
jgi:hypothetical protein